MDEWFDLTCDATVRLLPKYLDEDLSEPQAVRVEQHIVVCPGCHAYLSQLRRTVAAVAGLRSGAAGPERVRLWAAIAAHLPEDKAPAGRGAPLRYSAQAGSVSASAAGRQVGPATVAYKFLAADRTANFSVVRWPEPRAAVSDDGGWVRASAPASVCRRAVHACRPTDLAYWLDATLWQVELAGAITESATKIAGDRGRLVARVDGWPEAGAGFIADCAARLRDLLDGARQYKDHRAVRMLTAYAREIVDDTDPASVSYTVAHAAGVVGWLPGEGPTAQQRGVGTPFDAERRRQSRWLASQLGLPGEEP